MKNELLDKTEFAVIILTTRGEIKIDCDPESRKVGYHYKPTDRMDPYMNGPLTAEGGIDGCCDKEQIRSYLKRSWLDETNDAIVERIERAAQLVFALAMNEYYVQTKVQMGSDEYGNERFGPHDTLNDSLACVSRLFWSADGDAVERVVGVLVNDEDDLSDD